MAKNKTLANMEEEDIIQKTTKLAWSVKYKNFEFYAYENYFYEERPILSCYIFRDNQLLEHSGRTKYYTQDKALEELKTKYQFYLKDEAINLLTKCSIVLVVPESECLNNERLTIQLYKKDTTKEQWEKLLELFDIKR